ncbi:peptide deformylase [Desulfocucumis palustris]|uniref:Peptide deformylase n=1 Tax=Desulfocucumis palustris TaxID=1898651 RepID=A0A2L2XL80_9FIRM|nr:peptide deformylase [Desulfocucumis palustris]GBF35056.1 peptide deformylase [Desulfocucumis palustris]
MAERMIGKIGDPVLRKVCKPVTEITPNTLQLLDDMAETLATAKNGAALAAPQVGIVRRIIVIDSGDGVIELINPEILEKHGEQIGPEGCLSLPDIWGRVKRAKYVKVKATNREGSEFIMEGKDFMARCLQHEIDHLDGILFIDHVPPGQLFSEKTNRPIDVYDLIKTSRPNNL